MFVITDVNQAGVTFPAIGNNRSLSADLSSDDLMENIFLAVGDNLGVHPAFALVNAKDRPLIRTPAALTGKTPSSFAAKVGLVTFGYTLNYPDKFPLLFEVDKVTKQLVETVDRIAIDPYYQTRFSSVNVDTKIPTNLFYFVIA